MKYFILYGLIGNWIAGLFMTEETIKCLIAFAVLIGGAIVCEMIFTSLKKKKQYLLCLGVLAAYILIYGVVMITVILILYVIAHMMESQDHAPKTKRTSEVENRERRNLLLLESFSSDKVLRSLDSYNQQLYKNELENLFYDDSYTEQEAEMRIRRWDFYIDNPMEGSERWKKLHSAD